MSNYFDQKAANHYTTYVVKEPAELLPFLLTTISGISRTKAKEYLSQRMVYVNNQIVTQFNHPLQKGQIVQVASNRHKRTVASKMVKIVYEDAFLIVVEKKEGILTNSVPGDRRESVKTILDEYVKRQSKAFAVHTIHRLDKGTSGLLLFAKRRDIQKIFVDNWRDIVADRRYVAVVQGDMEQNSGTITSWLQDNKMFVTYSSPTDNGGKLAITHYRTLKRKNGFSLVELKLETGRKNQIRVHMQDIGHPIVGDYKYGYQASEEPIVTTKERPRIHLHAFRLAFRHPITGESLKFETPYPESFTALVK
ncbi:MAG: RluA family pseudouridine synthase [Bacteroidaceae bacterium]|nr:RluA family pseudouridine synthase [Bacteroidaceae bacterium]MBR1520616.1 RluA family pseudouridine synthase [Bacteroidaceae bacterium]